MPRTIRTKSRRFQSTPSVWRETSPADVIPVGLLFQSTPSVWRETSSSSLTAGTGAISIHSLRVEGDRNRRRHPRSYQNFNPLPPCGGRPFQAFSDVHAGHFNPLPPCGGRHRAPYHPSSTAYFNPLPPCGGRRFVDALCQTVQRFQSTPSVWRETPFSSTKTATQFISIHSLRVEGDFAA